MKDAEFTRLLKKLSNANQKYKSLLQEAEDEIVRRFGVHPSDIDNDDWIDTYHIGSGRMTATNVRDSMNFHIQLCHDDKIQYLKDTTNPSFD